jgi:class 3 adenylate cyclase/tetratricopeptide (TPR) repeat protein
VTSCASCGTENREGASFCDSCGAALAPADTPREQRKTVTVLFCDVMGSTARAEQLDPEATRATMSRYFDAARVAIERHGGTVEKFIGDAVMAVFGIPQVHEDDALRAVRAAIDLRDAVEIDVRIGVNTGQVVTGTSDTLVTGDAVNVAARLEQAASPGDVFIGAETYRLVRDAVDVDLLPPLEAKGKSDPLTAYRLLSLTGEQAHVRRLDAPLVGRTRESRLLAGAWERVRSERACSLFTVLGAAGVGKSRLAQEFLAGVDATVVSARCLSYGEGITYWPAVEIVEQLLQSEEPDDPGLRALLGRGHASNDDIAFGVRKLLEARAAQRPVVVLLDDLHWGEPAFLDLVEHVADWSRGAPILLLCLARPELLERRPGWSGGKLNATTALLEPLAPDETEELIDVLLGDDRLDSALRSRIGVAAEGNPLFVEEMLAMIHERGPDDVSVPPTIQALLASRIDQLPRLERAALERGAIEGQVFHRSAVQALTPDDPELATHLMGLVRKELVRPSPSTRPGDDAFRFRHLLIRDAAYEALPKTTRADLHERFADWMSEHGADLVELDEILGYHLEQAAQYRLELGRPTAELAARAARLLGAAGLRALDRDDAHAAANLLSRAIDLLGPDDPAHVPLLSALAEAVYGLGELERCHELLAVAIERGIELGQNGAVARARIFSAYLLGHSDTETSSLLEEADRTLAELRGADDDENLARAYTVRGWLCFWVGRADESTEEARRAIEHAVRAASPSLEAKAVALLVAGMRAGRTPWSELERFIEGRVARAGGRLGGRLGSGLLDGRGAALAARGEFDAARQVFDELRQASLEDGMLLSLISNVAQESGEAELRARQWTAAERILREAWDELGAAGEGGFRSTMGTMLATALVAQERLDEAETLVAECERITSRDDFVTHVGVELVRARIASARAQHDEAVDHANAALEVVGPTDSLELRADAYIVLGEALLAAGRRPEAVTALETAEAQALQKGSLVLAAEARALLDRIERTIG